MGVAHYYTVSAQQELGIMGVAHYYTVSDQHDWDMNLGSFDLESSVPLIYQAMFHVFYERLRRMFHQDYNSNS